ncbi:MAG TPA: hypothetical protein VMH01_10090 [Puia sp.]|nr:hypothetical protein [Puia sp.]
MRKAKPVARGKIVLTDSKETLIASYVDRIKELEVQLDQLNLLDHSARIKEVCIELIVTRENLKEKSVDAWKASLAAEYIETLPSILKY